MNSLPKTVTRQRRDCNLNPDPSASESSSLTTRLPDIRVNAQRLSWMLPISVLTDQTVSLFGAQTKTQRDKETDRQKVQMA